MRILLASLLLLAPVLRAADQTITATITITNTAANGNTFTLNADTRTWTNAVTLSTHILVGASIGATTTNLFNHIAGNDFASATLLPLAATNQVSIRGFLNAAMGASIGGAWGTVAYVTNTLTSLTVARFPLASVGATERATVANGIINGITSYATAQASAGVTPFTNFVATTGAQNIGGVKTFLDGIVIAGTATLSSSTVDGGTLTNSVMELDDTPSGHLEFWDGANNFISKIGSTNGYPALFTAARATLDVGSPNASMILNRISAENILGSKTLNNTWTGTNTFSRITNSVVVNSTFNAGTYDGTMVNMTNGVIWTAGLNAPTITNATVKGMFAPRVNDTTLANAPASNLLPVQTTHFVKLKAGPTGAFNLTGLDSGSDGETLIVYNATGQNMTVQHENGAVSAANRITTMTGADVASTGNCVAMFIYDSEDSRWIFYNMQD